MIFCAVFILQLLQIHQEDLTWFDPNPIQHSLQLLVEKIFIQIIKLPVLIAQQLPHLIEFNLITSQLRELNPQFYKISSDIQKDQNYSFLCFSA